jgi:hypothetical protein
MRFTTMIMTSAAVLLLASTTPAQAAPYSDVAPAVEAVTLAPVALTIAAAQETQPPAEVKVEISTKGGGGAWYTQPIWLVVGGLAFLVIILIVVMAARGGRNNTTVVK